MTTITMTQHAASVDGAACCLFCEAKMTEAKWDVFQKLYWEAIAYWVFVKAFREKPLPGAAMGLAAYGARSSLLLNIDKFVQLCKKTIEHKKEELRPDVGEEGKKTFEALRALCERGRDEEDFDDCGVSVYRDKVLGHPLNAVSTVLGKDTFAISLDWKTVEEAIQLMGKFLHAVEFYHCDKGTWDHTSVLGEMVDVEMDFKGLVIKFEDAAKYDNLARRILQKGGRAVVQIVNRQEIDLVE